MGTLRLKYLIHGYFDPLATAPNQSLRAGSVGFSPSGGVAVKELNLNEKILWIYIVNNMVLELCSCLKQQPSLGPGSRFANA